MEAGLLTVTATGRRGLEAVAGCIVHGSSQEQQIQAVVVGGGGMRQAITLQVALVVRFILIYQMFTTFTAGVTSQLQRLVSTKKLLHSGWPI